MSDIWTCTIGEHPVDLHRAPDAPMRQAVSAAYRSITGHEPTFLFSGWGAKLSEGQRAVVVENRTPNYEAGVTQAAHDVLAERQRQVDAEGWTTKHDSERPTKMATAAACYALYTDAYPNTGQPPSEWPFHPTWWKPTNFRRDLVKAGALILAEIERIDRLRAMYKDQEQPNVND